MISPGTERSLQQLSSLLSKHLEPLVVELKRSNDLAEQVKIVISGSSPQNEVMTTGSGPVHLSAPKVLTQLESSTTMAIRLAIADFCRKHQWVNDPQDSAGAPLKDLFRTITDLL